MQKDVRLPELGVNQNILNIITPAGLEFSKAGLMSGDSYAKIMSIVRYPTHPELGWLEKITQIEGVITKFEITPTDSTSLIERCNEQYRDYQTDLPNIKEESERQAKQRAVDDLRTMIERIQMGEPVVYLNILLMVMGPTEEKMLEQLRKVQGYIASLGAAARVLMFRQDQSYKCITPYGLPDEQVETFGLRNMPLSTFFGGFLNASSGINDGTGHLLGKSSNGKPIIINTRKRGDDRTNGNWFVDGMPGSGKSSFVKDLIFREYAFGAKHIILDPEKEFCDLARNLGGKVVNCGGGKGGRINALQIRVVPKDDDGEDSPLFENNKGSSDLAYHIQSLRTFFRLYKHEITQLQLDMLEEVLEGTYARFGITWETDIGSLKSTDYPLFSDLYEDISKAAEKDEGDSDLKTLKTYFRSIAAGADAQVFNGHTDLEANEDIVDLDISNLLEGDENVLKAQLYIINSWAWNEICRSQNEYVNYVVDEGYLHVDPKRPETLKFLKNMSKRIRKRGGALIFVTHAVADVLEPDVKREGQPLLENSCFKMIMGSDGKNLEETVQLFKLTEAEQSVILSRQRGKGLLFVGASRINAQVIIPKRFLELMGKAGGN